VIFILKSNFELLFGMNIQDINNFRTNTLWLARFSLASRHGGRADAHWDFNPTILIENNKLNT